MPITKTNTSVLSGVTTGQTSSAVSISGAYAASIYADLAVVGTPSASATWQIQLSVDGTNYYNYGPAYAAALAAGTYAWEIALDVAAVDVQIVFTAQTGRDQRDFYRPARPGNRGLICSQGSGRKSPRSAHR